MAIVAKALLPPDPLPVGTPQDQFYTVINLNYFRVDVALLPALSFEVSQPVSPADGELYVLDGDWGLTFEDEAGDPIDGDGLLAYYTSGTWYYFVPALGILKRIGADFYTYDPDSSAAWQLYNPAASAVTSVNGSTGDVTTLQSLAIAFSDEATPITAGAGKVTFHVPYDFTLAGDKVMVGLSTPQTSGSIFTVDVNVDGSTILSTKATIDNTEETTLTASTPLVCTATTLTKGQKVTVDVDQIGDGTAKGGKVYLIGYPT